MTSKSARQRKESAGSNKVERLIDALSTAGMPKGIARTLAFITTNEDWATSKDIEHATRLRQPEVSIAVRDLADRGWVERDSLKRESKGRPICIYRMAADLSKVYKAIEATERKKTAAVEANLKNIRQLWSIK
jgi:predicted transcriptional regulator